MVENVDNNIGRLRDELHQLDLGENTLIVFTSDNGGIRFFSSQNPLRVGKGSYYEGSIGVSFIIMWPGKIKEGSTNATPIVKQTYFQHLWKF